MIRVLSTFILAIALAGGFLPPTEVLRQDFQVESDPGIQLFVREVSVPSGGPSAGRSILLLHGARVGGVASFDLPVAGGSLAADLAEHGISEQDKSVWRDPAVADAYVAAALASDPTSSSRTPPSFRSPCGALEDSFYLATGRQLWDASLVTAPTLILASEHDFWSRPEDRENLANDLVHSAKVRVVVIPGATHFVHLERANHGRDVLIKEVVSFVPSQTNP
jgi:pimeloyl-ACP methyl ester carboxylesterase